MESLPTRIKQAVKILIKGTNSGKPEFVEIPSITPEEVVEARTFFKREKYFIFGHARSGTTLLARLIRLHPDVHCNWQAHFFTRPPLLQCIVTNPEVKGWLSHKSMRWNRGKDMSPVIMRAVADYMLERDAQAEGKDIVGDKSPSSVFHGGAVRNMAAVYPDGRLINIVRDGRDTAISHRFQVFVDHQEKMTSNDRKIRNSFVLDPQAFLNGPKSIFTEKSILELAESWARNVNETESEGLRLFGDHYYQFRYEDLMTDPWEEMCKVWRFLGADKPDKKLKATIESEMAANPDKDWQQEKSGDLAQYIPKGQKGNWQTLFKARDKEIFKQVAGELLIKWGYEKDLEW